MDPTVTTMAELIDAFIAADRLPPLGASTLSRLAFWPGAFSLAGDGSGLHWLGRASILT